MISKDINAKTKEFLDLRSLAIGNEEGHLTKYMYHIVGSLYDEFIREENRYYLPYEERNVINKFVKHYQLGKIENVIELGAGTETSLTDKTIPLLKCFHALRYKAVDLNHEYCEEIHRCINKSLASIDVSVIEEDFIYGNFLSTSNNNVYILLGSTIGNLIQPDLVALLSKISSYLKSGDYFLLVWDSCRSEEVLQNAYYNQYTKQFILAIFQYFAQQYEHSDFSNRDLEVVYRFDRNSSCVKLGVKCKKDIAFYENGLKALFQEDTSYYPVYSYKYSFSHMREILRNLGFAVLQHESSESGMMNIALLSKK